MFGIGFGEILIIFLVVIVFVNPKDLPRLFRRLGRLVRQLRSLRESSAEYLKRIEREIAEADRAGPPRGTTGDDSTVGRQP